MEMMGLRLFLLTFPIGAMFGLIPAKVIYRRTYLEKLRKKDPYALAAFGAVAYFLFLEGVLFFCNSLQAGLGYLAGLCLFQIVWR